MTAAASGLRRIPIFSALAPEAQLEIERTSEEKQFPRRHVIFTADQSNDHVFVLLTGRIKLFRTSRTGRELTAEIVHPMDMFGEGQMFSDGEAYGVTSEVLEESSVVCITRRELSQAIRVSAPAAREFAKLQDRKRIEADNRLAEFVFFDVPTRIARLLGRFALSHGRNSRGGSLIRIKLTHQEIANLVGSTRETTTLILNDFRRRGLIEFAGRRIIVSDPETLSTMS